MSTLLDGFELISGSNPWVSTLAWYDGTFTSPTVTKTSSHVTQGSFTYRVQNSSVSGQDGLLAGSLLGGATINLSAYTSLLIDVFGVTMPTHTHALLYVLDSSFNQTTYATSVDALSGAVTLTVDLTTGGVDLTDCNIFIGVENDSSFEGAYDCYFDNLRASAGGAAFIAKNTLKLNQAVNRASTY